MNSISKNIVAAIAIFSVAFIARSTNAAELRLRSDARASGSVVHLSDVADILGADAGDAQTLGQIELMPTPAAGKQRQLSIREIQDTLERRGVNMLQCHFTGASQVVVSVGSEPAAKTVKSKALLSSSMQEAQRAVAAAIVQYLQRSNSADDPWTVDVVLTDAQAQAVLADVHHVAASGGQKPWVGPQNFDIEIRTDKGPALFTVAAKVGIPSAVVVTAKTVPRGAIIQAADVSLERTKPGTDVGDAFQTLDDVVGREAVLAIAPGQVLDPQYVRTPVMVKRGSVVTVFVQAPGVKIRTTGRVREDGGRDDQVTVESLLDRKTFLARVTGIDQVEVAAESTTMPQEAAPPLPTPTASMKRPPTKVHIATRPIAADSNDQTR